MWDRPRTATGPPRGRSGGPPEQLAPRNTRTTRKGHGASVGNRESAIQGASRRGSGGSREDRHEGAELPIGAAIEHPPSPLLRRASRTPPVPRVGADPCVCPLSPHLPSPRSPRPLRSTLFLRPSPLVPRPTDEVGHTTKTPASAVATAGRQRARRQTRGRGAVLVTVRLTRPLPSLPRRLRRPRAPAPSADHQSSICDHQSPLPPS